MPTSKRQARALSRRDAYPVVSLHPASGPPTDAGRNMGLAVLLSVLPRVLRWEFRGLLELQSVGKGARTQMFAAAAPRAVVADDPSGPVALAVGTVEVDHGASQPSRADPSERRPRKLRT